ncbi:hypothetical protein Cni_G01015 [Canna indica]|uniref:Uncharacterized protein n=1 Tax=Canna indica TaxID=4628 RepID=A0AAQ3JNU8_9LILI|nr:hypothetical protein Cni_G01015 [Canna indica]
MEKEWGVGRMAPRLRGGGGGLTGYPSRRPEVAVGLRPRWPAERSHVFGCRGGRNRCRPAALRGRARAGPGGWGMSGCRRDRRGPPCRVAGVHALSRLLSVPP